MTTLTFEDFKPGRFGTFGPRHVSREEILAFATEFDPQPMHLDEEAAKKSMLRGLSGSGWHLGSLPRPASSPSRARSAMRAAKCCARWRRRL
jgi:acyl dehydratase